jgi:ABC-type phosphate transport system ATPase subunit
LRYLQFQIDEYRGISSTVTVDLQKFRLIPIIGVNECGKTTILEAITAFDFFNDDTNGGRHLEDIENLYSYEPSSPRIRAVIELTWEELNRLLDDVVKEAAKESAEKKAAAASAQTAGENASATQPTIASLLKKPVASYRRKRSVFGGKIIVQRDLKTKKYSIADSNFPETRLNARIARAAVRKLPYTLYFDDFRHQIPHEIPIQEGGETEEWLEILGVLFKQTDPSFDVLELPKIEIRKRKGIIAKVQQKLNATLTKQWQHFNLDDKEALSLAIQYEEKQSGENRLPYLSLDIVETDKNGQEHYFFVKNRSKGFFWFFNFVMRLEFNPKSTRFEQGAIYLLDEPGSYLHAAAQRRLCEKLRDLSGQNTVIYCTHSHHLLDPRVIPIGNIHIADKDANGSISLTRIFDHKSNLLASTFQPIQDALQIRPSVLDVSSGRVLVTEGMYDFFCFDMLASEKFHVVPATGAGSCRYLVSLLIGWGADYRVLWDNDREGREARDESAGFFGEEEARRRFRLLPLASPKAKKRILQDLFDGSDLVMFRDALGLPKNASFEKVILGWYYSPHRDALTKKLSIVTLRNFETAIDAIWHSEPVECAPPPGSAPN